MKRWFLLLTLILPVAVDAVAQLEMVPGDEPQRLIGGGERRIHVVFSNRWDKALSLQTLVSLVQTSSATTIRLSESPWKQVEVLPGQTILESATVSFPAVKAETRFLIQWLEGTNKVFGTTAVLVYPTNLLAELKPMAGDEPLGVFDPQNQLKPLLKLVAVEFTDLEDNGFEGFSGKLALVGPFGTKPQMREDLGKQIEKLASKGAAVIWMQPPPGKRDKLQPSFYTVITGSGAVVVVQSDLVANLAERPEAQLNLIHCARQALHPEPARLPQPSSPP